MWILSPLGFFSIVEKPNDRTSGTLTIRARVRADLERLKEQKLPGMGPIMEHAGTDYRYRAQAPRGDIAMALGNLVMKLDYANFKNEVAKRQGKQRASAYGKVWDVLYSLQDEAVKSDRPDATAPQETALRGKKMAYGGVLVNAMGQVLLREPKNHFDGYVWTFPKGRPDRGESPENAALREVREETGYAARIAQKIPGTFDGGTTVTEYFLMMPSGEPSAFDKKETQSIRWAALDEAAKLIAMTGNKTGRQRDLAVLDAVRTMLRKS